MFDTWVIDAGFSQDGLLCFIPVEGEIGTPDCRFITGMNFLADKPPEGKVIGIVHFDGQQAADKWYEENRELADAAMRPTNNSSVDL